MIPSSINPSTIPRSCSESTPIYMRQAITSEALMQINGTIRTAFVIAGTSSVSAARRRGAPSCSRWRRGEERIWVHSFIRKSYIAPWPNLFSSISEVNRVTGSRTQNPAKLHKRAAVLPPVFSTELITASKAALHAPLIIPANTLSRTAFRE